MMKISKNILMDMDGVVISGNTLIPGADRFIQQLLDRQSKFLVVTNNPIYTPGDLSHKLNLIGLKIPPERLFTSAMATAIFLQSQKPNGTAFVIGESGLTSALHEVGYVLTDVNPDYMVLGETPHYSYRTITTAVRLISKGARFIATNPDVSGPAEEGIVPACGAMAALIEKATGVSPLFVGKPNPLMMRTALNYLGVHSEDTLMIGDRMDTDIISGVESGMETILVLSGVTRQEEVWRYPYQPAHTVQSVAELDVI